MSKYLTRQLNKIVKVLLISLLLLVGQRMGWFENNKSNNSALSPGYYQVIQIFDGDTISVNMNGKEEKVRFIGVDTPETHDPRKSVECFGQAANKFTSDLVGQNSVRLESDPLSTNRDRYDRLLRYVYLPDGRLVNLEIINAGFGFAYTHYPFTKMDDFREAERQAREANRGLWSACPVNIDTKGFIHSGTP